MIKRLASFVFVIVLSLFVSTQTAMAHVLIQDDTKHVGAILHLDPDDDPIGGQESNLYFDIQSNDKSADLFAAKLYVTDSSGTETSVPVTIVKSLVKVKYTFPSQGVYNLRLTTEQGNSTYTFRYSQRVDRGVSTSAIDQPDYGWARLLLIVSVTLIVVLIIVGYDRRKQIIKQSKW